MTDLAPEIVAKVRASFEAQGLMTTFAAQMDQITAGEVTLSAPLTPAVSQQQGYAHAGLTFSLADSAGGYAALSLMPSEAEVVTAEFNIHLLAPAQGTRLEAKGRVIKPGRRLMVIASDVWAFAEDGSRRHVATGTGTMVPV